MGTVKCVRVLSVVGDAKHIAEIYYTYGSDGNLVSMNLNGVEYYYVRNAQGDI